MNNRNLDSTSYFVAVTLDITVHTAWTKYQPDLHVQADITREQAFEQFHQLKDVEIFVESELKKAMADSSQKYYQAKFSAPNAEKMLGLFKPETVNKSSDQNLIDIYGENCVSMQKSPITLVYQVKIPDELKQTIKIEDQKSIKLSENEKKKLKLELVIVPPFAIHATDEYASEFKKPTTEYLINHKELTAKNSTCVIL